MSEEARTLAWASASSPEATAAQNDMLRALQAALRRAMAGDPTADPAFWADLDAAYAAYDRYVAAALQGHPVSCAFACTACCHDNPHGVAGVEILRLSRHLAQTGLAERILPAAAEAAQDFAATRASAGAGDLMRAQRARRRSCPLLSAEGACQAYAARPIACRMFHALTPAAWCDPAHARFSERINPNLVPQRTLLQLLGAISRFLDQPAETTLWEGLASQPR